MAPLADFLLSVLPVQNVPVHYYTYVPGKTPMSTWPVVAATLVGYLVVIFGIQFIMKDRQPQKLNTLFRAHNVLLSSGSLLLLVLMMEEILPLMWKLGPYGGICAAEAWTPRMEFYYMVNYFFKYWELADTVFLALKKKPLAFLHVFHHSATALLCFSQLYGKTSISWTVISINLSVHVLMYYYYYASAGGHNIWWKRYLTVMQITQFVIDLNLVYIGTYMHFSYTYYNTTLWNLGDCVGAESSALFGCALLTSYLFLFIDFYFRTYKKSAGKTVKGSSKKN